MSENVSFLTRVRYVTLRTLYNIYNNIVKSIVNNITYYVTVRNMYYINSKYVTARTIDGVFYV